MKARIAMLAVPSPLPRAKAGGKGDSERQRRDFRDYNRVTEENRQTDRQEKP